MKRNSKHIIGLFGCLLILNSCNDFLDVQPEDQFLEEDVFGREQGIQNALNGIYTNLTNASSYGGDLTMRTVEIFAQQFNLSTDGHLLAEYGDYNFENGSVQNNIENIWSDTYDNILNINNLIAGLDTYDGVLSPDKKDILKGEATALRAMLHFDLLRLFGPIYSAFPGDAAIPYNTEASANLMPILPASEVIELILNDLGEAEQLLANDPIIEYGKIPVLQVDSYDLVPSNPGYGFEGTDFYRFRNLRFNYYAVKALQARVNLYSGNKTAANTAAKYVIDNASKWFPWTSFFSIISSNPDRIFSSEVLFGIQNNNIRQRHNSFYADVLQDVSILAANPNRLISTFEGNQNDYRFNSTWIIPSGGTKPYRTFFKYANITADQQFMQPLIKMSEMYYIVAETEPDRVVAIQSLNTVRFNRGLVNLASTVNIQNEITKEFRKEFYGEGQLFFYYKRNNFSEIPNGSTNNGNLTMNSSTYVLPLPLSETDFRGDN